MCKKYIQKLCIIILIIEFAILFEITALSWKNKKNSVCILITSQVVGDDPLKILFVRKKQMNIK